MTPGLLAIIEESKRLDGLATEGPWSKFGLTIQKETITNEPWTGCGYTSVIAEGFIHKLRGMSVEDAHSNAEFIAHSRNALPALVAEVERLQRVVDDLVYFYGLKLSNGPVMEPEDAPDAYAELKAMDRL